MQHPPAETPIDLFLVRALLQEQHPDLAGLPLEDCGEGWDNRTFRLGEAFVVRLPRRAVSALLTDRVRAALASDPRASPAVTRSHPGPHRPGGMRISLVVERNAMAAW